MLSTPPEDGEAEEEGKEIGGSYLRYLEKFLFRKDPSCVSQGQV